MCETETQRHVIVQAPDESISIAVNEDAPIPNAPPENIPESVIIMSPLHSLRLGVMAIDVTPRRIDNNSISPNEPRIMYPPGSKLLSYLLFIAALINLCWHRRAFDTFNFCLISFTSGALHSTHTISVLQILLHGVCSFLVLIPFYILGMWGQVVYQIGCISLCTYAYLKMVPFNGTYNMF